MIRDKKAKLDKQANGVIYGIMIAATRVTAPNLNRTIRGGTYYSLSMLRKLTWCGCEIVFSE